MSTESTSRQKAVREHSDPESFGRSILVQRLADQPRSRAELAETLAKKNVPAGVAEVLLDKFEAAGLIDDHEFAQTWVEARQRSKGLAPRALALELRRKGIGEEIIDDVLTALDSDSQREAASRLVQKKLRSMGGLDSTTQIRRLTGMLARKGYPPQLAFDVVRAELDGIPEPLESI